MAIMKWLGIGFSMVALTACASGSHVLTGAPRPAIDPSLVKVYSQAPNQPYDVIANLQASSSRGLSQQGRMDSAVASLKSEAAKLGANGVIINNYPNNSGGVTTHISTDISSGSRGIATGVGTGFTINPASIKGIAIYVASEAAIPNHQVPAAQ